MRKDSILDNTDGEVGVIWGAVNGAEDGNSVGITEEQVLLRGMLGEGRRRTMIYGYARVSTTGQARDGSSLESQSEQLRLAGCEEIYSDSYTGTKMERPGFSELMGKLRSGDRLVVAKLDRFARTASGGIECIRGLLNRGISVHILNMGLIDDTPTGRLMVTMLLAFAEFERDMIVERTSAGKAAAKTTDPEWREGRKEKVLDETLFAELRERNASGGASVAECCRELGISRGTWYNRVRSIA